MKPFASQRAGPGGEGARVSARSSLVDFLFTGAGIVPLALMAGGSLDLTLMLACPLLIGACFCALYFEGPASDGGAGRVDGIGMRSGQPHRDDRIVRRQRVARASLERWLTRPAMLHAAQGASPARRESRQPVAALLRPKEAAPVAAAGEPPAAWLVPLDGSPESLAAIRYVIAHTRPEHTRIHLLNVQPPVMSGDVSVLTSAETIVRLRHCAGEEALRAAGNRLRAHRFDFTCDVVLGVSAEEIVRQAARRRCGKIVMSTRRTGVIANVLGRSVSARVVRLSPVPVTIVKSGARPAEAREVPGAGSRLAFRNG